MSFHGVPVHVERDDICNKAECPISPGDFVLKNTEVLPGFTPPVSCGFQMLSVILILSMSCCMSVGNREFCYISYACMPCYTLKFVICFLVSH